MKTIGILGGTSYPSTALYYNTLNRLYNIKLGGYHSCPLILYSIDYHSIKRNYNEGWDKIPHLFLNELEKLLSMNPSCVIIANNTLHKAYDLIKDKINSDIPIFHIIHLTRDYILDKGFKNVLLLGTKFTMEDDYFKKPLVDSHINVMVPDEIERMEIQKIQTELSAGKLEDKHVQYFEYINEKYSHLDAFILGCTEIPLVYQKIEKPNVEIIDTLQLQCHKALEIF